MMNIIFDLDGTLIDSSERLYRLFQRLVPESGFTKEKYWELKRDKINHQMILEKYFPQYDFDAFNRKWLKMIELPEYLKMDIIYPDTVDVLKQLSANNHLVLLTARQSRIGLFDELKRLNLTDYFSVILVTEAKQSKSQLLCDILGKTIIRTQDDLFVGDMGIDICVGKKIGFKTVAISHGFMCKEKLMEYKPDILIDSLCEMLKML